MSCKSTLWRICTKSRALQNRRKVKTICFPMRDCSIDVEKVSLTNGLVHGTETKARENFPNFLREEFKEVHNKLRLSTEALSQYRVLRCNPDRAGVQMANSHQDAAGDNKRSGRKSKLFRTKQSCHDHIFAGLHLPIDLYRNTVAKTIEHQSLLSFGKT